MGFERHFRNGALAPDQEMWRALEEGKLLNTILEDFYSRVYADERLAPFFEDVRVERAIDKQFTFLKSVFTGERCYFGEHPKKAHHWMVISEDLFDYREQLMEDCLRRAGLAEHLIKRWRALEEVFRKSIVKSAPAPRKVGGRLIPAEGYNEAVIDMATLCDACEGEITEGTRVSYHVRTGKVYCAPCIADIREREAL